MIYQYTCSCGKNKEREFPMGQAQDVVCKCGNEMERIISIPKFRLLGEGWGGKSRM